MSHSLDSMGYVGDCIEEYYWAYEGDTRRFHYSSF